LHCWIFEVLAFFGQNPSGKREDLVQRLAEFLEHPKASDEVFKIPGEDGATESKKRKRSSSGSPKKKRAKKDPNAPKRFEIHLMNADCFYRALSSYMFYVKDAREDVKSKHPKAAPTEIMSMLGAQWKKIKENDKKKYEEKSKKDKERYEKEMKQYKKKSEK
jgi:hypothetical protein